MSTIKIIKSNPALRAKEIKALAEWYRDALGFKINFFWGEPISFSMVERGSVEFGIAARDATYGPISAFVIVEGVDELYAEFISRKVATSRVPTVQPYGMKDFDLTDPEGNRLCFGESMECEPAKG
ncbi:MAG: VOC family protein [Planctomycetota bacterium]|nr:VOC family protein [Planctomycetota bacterium]